MRYAGGHGALIWCRPPDLLGTVHWAEVDERAVRELLANLAAIGTADLAPRVRVLVDCRAIERVDPDAMLLLVERLRERLPGWSPRIERHAVVGSCDVAGILFAGALASLAPEHPTRFVHDLEAAVAFVDHPAARAAHAAASAEALRAGRRSELLERVRACMARDLGRATIVDCARELGLSPRSLQRALRRQGTSFSHELRASRVALAATLLATSDLKITAIAARVGFGTSARLGIALRRELRLSAGDLRRRRPRVAIGDAAVAHRD